MNTMNETALILPAYKPDERLIRYAKELLEAGAARIVAIDDGGGQAYDSIFETLEALGERVQVLRYTPNRGKGYALRTGMNWLKDHAESIQGLRWVVTADCDGQHKVEDVLRMAEKEAEYGNGLLLGSRDFSQKDVPFKSRAGNRLTSFFFKLLYGPWISDTQTGLRAFPVELLEQMSAVSGDRYEYETNVLIDCARKDTPMRPLTIETVYENNNEGSHFRPFRDGMRIYGILFGNFIKFTASSLLSFCVDYLMFLLINALIKLWGGPELENSTQFLFFHFVPHILIATGGARVISGIFNYLLNRKVVFHTTSQPVRTAFRFLCVFLLNLTLSAVLVSTFCTWTGWSESLLKIPVDLCLFFLSYTLQKKWVFRDQNSK